MKPPTPLIAGTLALVSSAALAQQQDEPDDLTKLRESYNTKLAETLRPTVAEFHKQLAAVEQAQATGGDYIAAHAANARAASLTIQFAELTDAPAAGFTLDASRASTSGAVSLDRSAAVLKKFSSVGSRATWDARQATPGDYEVYLTYATALPIENPDYLNDTSLPEELVAGGTVTIREATSLARTDDDALSFEVSPTGGWDTFSTVKAGPLTIRSASTSIELSATAVEPEGVMHLREIRFKRIPPPPTPTSPPPTALAELQATHQKNLTTALDPVTADHIASLEKLATQVSASGNLDAVVAIRAEIERAQNQTDQITSPAPDTITAGAIVLPAVDTLRVRTSESVTASSKGHLTSLAPAGAFVEWDIARLSLPPGFYEIGLRFRSTDRSGGTYRVQSGESTFTGSIRRDSSFSTETPFRDRPAGILYLVADSEQLRLTTTNILPGGDTLCQLEAISLRLTDRAAFDQAKATEDSGTGQWVKLDNPRYTPDNDTVAADNLRISHAGQSYHLRLYGADCPYLVKGESPGANQLANFGLTAQQLTQIAKDAQKLLNDLLKAGPFLVYTKNESASQEGKNDRIYAFVVTQSGLLSQQLVLAGLARVDGQFSDAPAEINPGVTPEVHQQWLLGEQEKARKANRGMWKFKQ